MTKLTKTVRATIRDVLRASPMPASPHMKRITASVIRENLRDDHGIVMRVKSLLRIMERVG